MISTDALYDKAIGLAPDLDDNFLELSRALRQLLERDADLFKKAIGKSKIGVRKAYYLVNISRAFDPLKVSRARLRALGWTKLQALVPYVDEGNVEELVEIAENNTATRLRAILKGEKPPKDSHCLLMYFSARDFQIVADALAKFGGVVAGRGIQNKEKALLALIKSTESAAVKA